MDSQSESVICYFCNQFKSEVCKNLNSVFFKHIEIENYTSDKFFMLISYIQESEKIHHDIKMKKNKI